MQDEISAKTLAGICGLYCGACAWYIGTTEEPERLAQLAARRGFALEDSRCYGCGSGRRNAHCASCRIAVCASARGIKFCGECRDYPCAGLREFQSALPHRLRLWRFPARTRAAGQALGRHACN